MQDTKITIHGPITHGTDHTPVACPQCQATHSHTVRGHLSDAAVPVMVTCVNGHDVPLPAAIDGRELLFTAAMRAE